MSNLVIALVSGGGITALGVCVAAYYYGVKTGRAMERDINDAKIMAVLKKMQEEGLKEVTAKDVSDRLGAGTI